VLPLLQAGIKDLIDRPRPTEDVADLRAGYTSESFPSGHVMSPTLLYGYALWLAATDRLPAIVRALRWPLVAWSVAVLALTGFVNVWLGVHWPSDVIGAYAWGGVLAAATALAVAALARHPT
jgi:undecaprenyl-diphosphatase